LRENRLDDANDKVIQHRLEVYDQETKPVLEHYRLDRIVQIDATMSQIQIASEIIRVLVPIKLALDKKRDEAA
jgi:adenylate kinase